MFTLHICSNDTKKQNKKNIVRSNVYFAQMALWSKDRCLNSVVTVIDDGKLSFEEFKAYFSDGVLSGEELKELFHKIDTHNTE